jgi:hyperosmotically inducible protein
VNLDHQPEARRRKVFSAPNLHVEPEEEAMKLRSLLCAGAAVLVAACAQSDAGITTSVKSQLVDDELVRARNINVDTQNRVVTLQGDVRSAEEEARALEIARNTDGVSNVIDEIEIVQAAPTTGIGGTPTQPGGADDVLTTDPNITAQVKAQLLGDPTVAGLAIDVDTRDRMVTLTGTVKSEEEKSRALQLAREVEGVLRVEDKLMVQARR